MMFFSSSIFCLSVFDQSKYNGKIAHRFQWPVQVQWKDIAQISIFINWRCVIALDCSILGFVLQKLDVYGFF